MSIIGRLLGGGRPRDRLAPVYRAIVREARRPEWYREGQVPDTLDGRFDMVAAVMALTLLRLEKDGDAFRPEQALLAELFVDDMDGQLRERGIGDLVVGKHIGRMMGALGGRLAAFRYGMADGGDLRGAALRNLYRGEMPSDTALDATVAGLHALWARLHAIPGERLMKGHFE